MAHILSTWTLNSSTHSFPRPIACCFSTFFLLGRLLTCVFIVVDSRSWDYICLKHVFFLSQLFQDFIVFNCLFCFICWWIFAFDICQKLIHSFDTVKTSATDHYPLVASPCTRLQPFLYDCLSIMTQHHRNHDDGGRPFYFLLPGPLHFFRFLYFERPHSHWRENELQFARIISDRPQIHQIPLRNKPFREAAKKVEFKTHSSNVNSFRAVQIVRSMWILFQITQIRPHHPIICNLLV